MSMIQSCHFSFAGPSSLFLHTRVGPKIRTEGSTLTINGRIETLLYLLLFAPPSSMQRNKGLTSLSRQHLSTTSYTTLSTTLSSQQLQTLQTHLTQFRTSLTLLAQKHRKIIRDDPVFREYFVNMCANIGVDPLSGPLGPSSSGSGMGMGMGMGKWWTDTKEGFGFFSDWTYELAVQIIDICVSTRDLNGGIIELSELLRLLRKLRGLPDPDPGSAPGSYPSYPSDIKIPNTDDKGGISEKDVLRAIKTLEPLSSGYSIISLSHSGRKAVQSVRKEMDDDQHAIISLAAAGSSSSSSPSIPHPSSTSTPHPHPPPPEQEQELGVVTPSSLTRTYKWTPTRAQTALDNAVRNGICWVDLQALDSQSGGGEVKYWVPAVLEF